MAQKNKILNNLLLEIPLKTNDTKKSISSTALQLYLRHPYKNERHKKN